MGQNNMADISSDSIIFSSEQIKQLSANFCKDFVKLTEVISQRVLRRLAHTLIKEDLKEIENINRGDEDGSKLRAFLLTKIPNLDKIINEEVTKYGLTS